MLPEVKSNSHVVMQSNSESILRFNYALLRAYHILVLFLILVCSDRPVNGHQEVANSSQIEQKEADIQQTEQVELLMSELDRFNEISRVHDKCSTARENLDSCSARLIDMTHNVHNMEEFNDVLCPKFKEITACIKNSTDCYKPFEKQIINWILTSTRKMNHKRCKNEGEKQKFLRLTQSCFATKNPINKCMTTYISNLEAIADLNKFIERLSENDIQIQLSCCANMRFKQCVMNNARDYCKPSDRLRKLQRANSVSSQRVVHKYIQKSTFDMMENLKEILDSMALTGPEFICQNVEEDFCRAKFDGRFKLRRPRYKSIVPAMISIYSNKPE